MSTTYTLKLTEYEERVLIMALIAYKRRATERGEGDIIDNLIYSITDPDGGTQ